MHEVVELLLVRHQELGGAWGVCKRMGHRACVLRGQKRSMCMKTLSCCSSVTSSSVAPGVCINQWGMCDNRR